MVRNCLGEKLSGEKLSWVVKCRVGNCRGEKTSW